MDSYGVSLNIDAVGLFCPMPIVALKLGLKDVEEGEIVKLTSDDPGIKKDLPAWCYSTNNTLLSIKNEKDIFIAYVKKSALLK